MSIRLSQVFTIPVQHQVLRIGTVSLMMGGLCGCANLAKSRLSFLPRPNVPITTIGDVQKSSPKSSTVYLEGEVGKQVPFVDSSAYELKDSTGSIWVVTKQKAPNQKDQVLLKAKVQHKNISVGGKTLKEVYVEEQQRL
ncbi:hypothetical protein [Microseira wollei]|uniref:Uncharacterized protein n=1 Tax=Microseira wollei NIES-4236 TaxID=2530354 RepID=A0AAV3X7V7_9CYAN|nr:hypothetical protein [Microseira wollei]GET38238.1 hypothetical protein MiSe_29920 [Microseira wollei NIES-4236]